MSDLNFFDFSNLFVQKFIISAEGWKKIEELRNFDF